METNSFFAIIQIALLTVQQLFWSVVSDGGQTAQFVPLVCNNVAICGSSRPFYSLSVLSLTTCTTECYFNQYQSAPCVGFNYRYRSTNQTCDIFTKEPLFFANDMPGCQYYQDTRDTHSNCTALPGLESVTFSASMAGTAPVLAMALLNEQLFFTRLYFAGVLVHNSTSFKPLRVLTFSGLSKRLFGLATDPNDNSLFISDWLNLCLYRVDLSATPTVSWRNWTVMNYPRALSVTSNGNLMVVFENQVISEYTPNGTLVRQITDVNQLWHAVQVNNDVWAYVVRNPLHGVCTAFTNGTVIKCYGSTAAGSAITQMSSPRNLALDARGYIFVSDHDNNRILIVNPSLTEARQLKLPVSPALQSPLALLLSPSRNCLYISEDTTSSRILSFDIK